LKGLSAQNQKSRARNAEKARIPPPAPRTSNIRMAKIAKKKLFKEFFEESNLAEPSSGHKQPKHIVKPILVLFENDGKV
jgi:hypothetical protein